MDIVKKLEKLIKQEGFTQYKLSKACGLSQSTLANIFRRNTIPSILTLQIICDGLGITLAQFFTEDEDTVKLTPELKNLFEQWKALSHEQKNLIYNIL